MQMWSLLQARIKAARSGETLPGRKRAADGQGGRPDRARRERQYE